MLECNCTARTNLDDSSFATDANSRVWHLIDSVGRTTECFAEMQFVKMLVLSAESKFVHAKLGVIRKALQI